MTAPTRLMVGEHGTLDPDEVRRMAARRDVRTVVVPGAGHDVHLDRPEVTARLVLDFLGGG